jgi:hypothetical protein
MNLKQLGLFVFLLFSLASYGQDKEKTLIQFSGVVVSGDDLEPISFTSIMIQNTHRGTISDYYGYFSFVAEVNDTILFSSIGYKDAQFIIPDTLPSFRYSIIQLLQPDTVVLPEATVYPWPTKEQFKQAFLNAYVPDDDLARAQKNLDPRTMESLMASIPMGPSGNFKYQMQEYQTRIYYSGQAPPLNILNPLAWAKFIQAWKDGDFKQEK